MKKFAAFSLYALLAACSSPRETVKQSVETHTETVIKDTTFMVPVPPLADILPVIFENDSISVAELVTNKDTTRITHFKKKKKMKREEKRDSIPFTAQLKSTNTSSKVEIIKEPEKPPPREPSFIEKIGWGTVVLTVLLAIVTGLVIAYINLKA